MDAGFAVGTREWLACGQKRPRLSVGKAGVRTRSRSWNCSLAIDPRYRVVPGGEDPMSFSLIMASFTPGTQNASFLASTDGFVDRSDGGRAAPKDSFVYPTQEFLRSFEKSSTGSLCQ